MGALGTDVAAGVAAVRARIATAAQQAGRAVGDVRLVAVSKTHPPAVVEAALAAGVTDFGENRVAELVDKAAAVASDGTLPRWHHIGRLQSRKARDVVGVAALIHSVDRASLADELDKRAAAAGVTQQVLVQVNVGDDPAKAGCALDETPALVAYASARDNLDVVGLMTMPPLPPVGTDPNAAARPLFARLRELRDGLHPAFPKVRELSMGMSADLEAAVAEGATMVRVGSAIFGARGDGPWQPGEPR